MQETPLVTPVNPDTLQPQLQPENVSSNKPVSLYILFVLVVLVGVLTGYLLSKKSSPSSTVTNTTTAGKDAIQTKNEVGSSDTSTFSDHAQGTLEAGGLNGTGTHKLVRDGGPSQTVYLVSSIIDLDQYVGKKVEIWGQTLQSKKVGWLMDVGRLKITE